MAREQSFEMYGHPSIYDHKIRKLKVYFSEPEEGVSENTGVLLSIAGFAEMQTHRSLCNLLKQLRLDISSD